MDVTIQIDDELFNRFKIVSEAFDVAPGDYLESLVSNALNEIMDGTVEVFKKQLPGFQQDDQAG